MSGQSQRHSGLSRKARLTAAIESLELRRMLAVFTGTAGNDSISIQSNGSSTTVDINAIPVTTTDTSIIINAGDGNDSFIITSTRAGTTG